MSTNPATTTDRRPGETVVPITGEYRRETLERRQHAASEFLAWADDHQRRERLHAAELAQITRHPEGAPERDAIGQQRAWARRQARRQHLHESAMAHLRHR